MTDHMGRVSRPVGSDRVRAAYAVAQALKDNDIKHVFLVTGGDLWLWRALRDVGITMHLARSEAGAVVMADAYARVTGRPAVVYGQWGPGAANVAGALADAWWARSPVLALTSAVSTRGENRLEYQELHQAPMFGPITKWQARVTRADRAAELVSTALRMATAGCPGPVHLDIPTDLFTEEVELAQSYRLSSPAFPPAPSCMAVEAIVARLGKAQRPLILSGNGLLIAQGTEELRTLAEVTSIPIMTTMGGKGSIREDHPLAMGVVGRYSRRVCNQIAAEADLVIAFGTDLGALATDTYRIPGPDTVVVQVDVSAERMSSSRPVDVAIVADAREVASALIHRLRDTKPLEQHVTWSRYVQEKLVEWHADFTAQARRPASSHVRQEALIQILSELIHPNDIVVVDTGFMGAWGGALYPVRAAGRTFLRAAGTLGWAFPSVLGAQLALSATPERRAIALIGDGGFGYHIGDLETAVRLELPAICIVLNNASLAYEAIAFKYLFDGDVVDEVCDFIDTDYSQIARDFGCFGARIDTAECFHQALSEALSQRKPAVLDVIVSKSRFAPVTTFDHCVTRDL